MLAYSVERKTLTLKLCDCNHGFRSVVSLGSDLPVSVPWFLLVCVFHTNAWLLNPTVGWTLTKPIRLMRENALPDDHFISYHNPLTHPQKHVSTHSTFPYLTSHSWQLATLNNNLIPLPFNHPSVICIISMTNNCKPCKTADKIKKENKKFTILMTR